MFSSFSDILAYDASYPDDSLYPGRQIHFEMCVVSINTVQESEYPIFLKGMVNPAPTLKTDIVRSC
jgi:hypothetical protein